jgi:CheY-like chemotaxis protein
MQPQLPVVLVVDDEDLLRCFLCEVLEEAGYLVLAASNGNHALDISRRFPGNIDLVLSDVNMPQLDGIGLREQILQERPEIKVLLMSGNTGKLQGVEILRKPFKVEVLKRRLRKLLFASRHPKSFKELVIPDGKLSQQAIFETVLSEAVTGTTADMGNVQVFDHAEQALRIEAQIGFEHSYLHFFARVQEPRCACGEALRTGRRVVVEDVTKSPIFAENRSLEVMLEAGARAVQSTPIFNRSGILVGMLSTLYRDPTQLDDSQLKLIDDAAAELSALMSDDPKPSQNR